jgi:starvation-inducible DNA-binding protein
MTLETRTLGPVDTERDPVAHELSRLLADTYALYQKTLYYHWNVTGPSFPSLHRMFEKQYVELQEATDVVAERLRQLGVETPPFGQVMTRLTSVPDDEMAPGAMQMVHALADARDAVIATAHDVLGAADAHDDVATIDLVTQQIVGHEKAAWMLRSTAS